MSEKVLIPVPGMGVLMLDAEQIKEALRAGAEFAPPPPAAPVTSEPLLDAAGLAAALGVPQTWIEQAAREQRIPSIRAGRYVRFSRAAVEATLARNGAAA